MFSQARYFAVAPFSRLFVLQINQNLSGPLFYGYRNFVPKFTTKRAATRRVTDWYLSTAADKARQRPWRRPPGSKASWDRLVTS